MRKVLLITLAAAVSVVASVAAAGTGETQTQTQPVVYKWAGSVAADHPIAVSLQEAMDEIDRRTGGAVKIELHVANTLGSA